MAGCQPVNVPDAVPASALAAEFSAERQWRPAGDCQGAHPAGSPAQAGVRDYLVDQVAVTGLLAEIQKDGIIENVLVRLAGTDTTALC